MTAINVIIDENQVAIVTDTLAHSPLGPDFHVPKVTPIPHMRLAVATRGRMDALSKVVGAICVGSFDYDSCRAFLGEAYGRLGLNGVEIVVAGWSAKGPAAFTIHSVNSGGKVKDAEYVIVQPPTVPAPVFEAFLHDPVAQMPELLAAQAAGSRDVGGFMNVTTIGEHVIESYCAGPIG